MANLVIAAVCRVLIEFHLHDSWLNGLIVANTCEADGFKLGVQGSDRFLQIFGNVDLCIVDGRIGRIELIDHNLKRSLLRMCESKIYALSRRRTVRLKFINDELTREIANVRRQLGRLKSPEEVLGHQFVKYTHWSQYKYI